MFSIAVIGDRDSVLAFRALGFDVFPSDNPGQAAALLHKIARDNYAVIYITEQLAADLSDDISRYKDELKPAIILFPGKQGSLGIGMSALKDAVERAVGADILGS